MESILRKGLPLAMPATIKMNNTESLEVLQYKSQALTQFQRDGNGVPHPAFNNK